MACRSSELFCAKWVTCPWIAWMQARGCVKWRKLKHACAGRTLSLFFPRELSPAKKACVRFSLVRSMRRSKLVYPSFRFHSQAPESFCATARFCRDQPASLSRFRRPYIRRVPARLRAARLPTGMPWCSYGIPCERPSHLTPAKLFCSDESSPLLSSLLVAERINDRNAGIYLDRLAVQHGWSIAPLTDALGSGLHQ